MNFLYVSVLVLLVSILGLINYRTHYVTVNDYQFEVLIDGPIPFSIFFNDEPEKDIKLNLTAFAFELKERKDEIGYVISYAGKRAKKNESKSNIKKFKDFLIKKKKVDPKRLVFLEGGHREKGITELFIVPEGAIPPKPFPMLIPSEVIIIK